MFPGHQTTMESTEPPPSGSSITITGISQEWLSIADFPDDEEVFHIKHEEMDLTDLELEDQTIELVDLCSSDEESDLKPAGISGISARISWDEGFVDDGTMINSHSEFQMEGIGYRLATETKQSKLSTEQVVRADTVSQFITRESAAQTIRALHPNNEIHPDTWQATATSKQSELDRSRQDLVVSNSIGCSDYEMTRATLIGPLTSELSGQKVATSNSMMGDSETKIHLLDQANQQSCSNQESMFTVTSDQDPERSPKCTKQESTTSNIPPHLAINDRTSVTFSTLPHEAVNDFYKQKSFVYNTPSHIASHEAADELPKPGPKSFKETSVNTKTPPHASDYKFTRPGPKSYKEKLMSSKTLSHQNVNEMTRPGPKCFKQKLAPETLSNGRIHEFTKPGPKSWKQKAASSTALFHQGNTTINRPGPKCSKQNHDVAAVDVKTDDKKTNPKCLKQGLPSPPQDLINSGTKKRSFVPSLGEKEDLVPKKVLSQQLKKDLLVLKQSSKEKVDHTHDGKHTNQQTHGKESEDLPVGQSTEKPFMHTEVKQELNFSSHIQTVDNLRKCEEYKNDPTNYGDSSKQAEKSRREGDKPTIEQSKPSEFNLKDIVVAMKKVVNETTKSINRPVKKCLCGGETSNSDMGKGGNSPEIYKYNSPCDGYDKLKTKDSRKNNQKRQHETSDREPNFIEEKEMDVKDDLSDPAMQKAIEEQVEKCQKLLYPILNQMIRSGVEEITASKRKSECSGVKSDEDEDAPLSKVFVHSDRLGEPKSQNRRFQKPPIRVPQEPKTEPNDENVVKNQNEGKVKMYLQKRLTSEASKDQWVVKDIIGASASVPEYYVCDVCEFYDCFSLQCMRNHELTHKGPKYSCDSCTKTFFTKGELTIHQNATHCWVDCQLCGWQFRKGHLPAHMRRHFPTKHICSLCDKAYSRKSDLTKHISKCHEHLGSVAL